MKGKAASGPAIVASTVSSGTAQQEVSVTVESESESESEPPFQFQQCDKLPLVGGRHLFRNRLRVVNQNLTEICGPKVLIIGSRNCGTDRLAELLVKHPRIHVNSCNLSNTQGGCNQGLFQAALKQKLIFEGNDFTHIHRNDPKDWMHKFGRRLPVTDGINTITFDKSPSYMDVSFFPDVAKLSKKHLPTAKIVATLCNPAERLLDEFQHVRDSDPNGFNQFYQDNDVTPPTDFPAFIDLLKPDNPICHEKDGFCESNRRQYLSKGEFLNNLRPWYEQYGRRNVLVVDMKVDPTVLVEKLLKHIDSDILPVSEYPWDEMKFFENIPDDGHVSANQSFDNDDIHWLEKYYAPHNDDLAKEIHEEWPKKWSCRYHNDCD